MNEDAGIGADGAIVQEACAWVAQIESGRLTASDLAALREWMARSPVHAEEVRKVAALSGQLAILTERAGDLEAAAKVGHRWRRGRWMRVGVGPAGVMLAVAIIAVAALVIALLPETAHPVLYKTAVGEYRTVALEDGTSVSLNTDSQIEVDYTDEERRVRLVNGEALFDVAHQPKRPFVVYSDSAVAEAVGTSFVVRLKNAVTELAVVEGAVAFSTLPRSINARDERARRSADAAHAGEAPARLVVTAGQVVDSAALARLSRGGPGREIPRLTDRAIQRKLSWTDGFLEFSDTPLEEVVYELTRHNNVSIVIADPALKELKFGGIFRTGDVDQLLDALEGLGVTAEQTGENAYRLHRSETD